jgi:hypothetical protein
MSERFSAGQKQYEKSNKSPLPFAPFVPNLKA